MPPAPNMVVGIAVVISITQCILFKELLMQTLYPMDNHALPCVAASSIAAAEEMCVFLQSSDYILTLLLSPVPWYAI